MCSFDYLRSEKFKKRWLLPQKNRNSNKGGKISVVREIKKLANSLKWSEKGRDKNNWGCFFGSVWKNKKQSRNWC